MNLPPIYWPSHLLPKRKKPLIKKVERKDPVKWPDEALKKLLKDLQNKS